MSEKCKTCEHWKLPGDCTVFGDCRKLPSIIRMDKLSVTVPYDFYCSSHTPKPRVPYIVNVWVEHMTAGQPCSIRMGYHTLPKDMREATLEFLTLTEPRDEQDGG